MILKFLSFIGIQ